MKAPIPVTEARARLLALCPPLATEEVPIREALGRALAQDVVAARTLPPWDNSAMDGYALRAADLGAERLRVIGVAAAGGSRGLRVEAGTCARIYTGAPLPDGADTVVMQEKVRVEGEAIVLVEPPAAHANVRKAGEDAQAGAPLLAAGTALGIPEAALLWAQGQTQVRVPRRPRVAILSTGDELLEVGAAPEPDRIFDTNSPSIAEAVRRAGGVPTLLGIARDSLEAVTAKLREAEGFDVVISSAGVSVGDRDHVRPALEALGVSLDFWRVALKPGKPLVVGTRGATLFFGLPGNPTSSLVTFELFVRPALRRMAGIADVEPRRCAGRLRGTFRKAVGLTHYLRAIATYEEGALWATPLATQTSGALRSASAATHLIEVAPSTTGLANGDPVTLLPVSWGPDPA